MTSLTDPSKLISYFPFESQTLTAQDTSTVREVYSTAEGKIVHITGLSDIVYYTTSELKT